ncbi:MAG: hypothetical protein QOH34_496 [Mycobacterium sp.]|jgi:hypothetical protein|nr:hypothetical protein [Mycobacterium sp.]
MRDQYLPPQVTRLASVKDLTLAGQPGLLLDVCISITNLGVSAQVGIPADGCQAVIS